MRVISGTAKGHALYAPKGLGTRPTEDMVRESFFNIISNMVRIEGCRFLDMFAGSGAMGIEALSRGAGFAVFADSSKESVGTIRRNLAKTRLESRAAVYRSDAVKALKRLSGGEGFGIIYMDPPYGSGLCGQAVSCIAENGILAGGGIVAAELAAKEEIPCAGLGIIRIREYPNSKIVFFGGI